jgi:hypothetical protein
MPNRYIREDAIKSKAVNSLGWQGEVFYRRLLNIVDDFGRYYADPGLLLSAVFPRQLHKVSQSDVRKLLLECEHAGLLRSWEVDGEPYLVLNKFEKGRSRQSKFPEPPPNIAQWLDTREYYGSGAKKGADVGGLGPGIRDLGSNEPNTGASVSDSGSNVSDSDSDSEELLGVLAQAREGGGAFKPGDELSNGAVVPTLREVKAWDVVIAGEPVTAEEAEAYWHSRMATDWKAGGQLRRPGQSDLMGFVRSLRVNNDPPRKGSGRGRISNSGEYTA